MEYNTILVQLNYFFGLLGFGFYVFSFFFFKFKFKNGSLILNENYTLIIIHCLTKFLIAIKINNLYQYINEKGILDLIIFILYTFQYYYLKNQIEKFLIRNDIFDSEINFEFNKFWLYHFFFIFLNFPYQIFNQKIINFLENIKIYLLMIYVISYFVFINKRIKQIINLFKEKLESSEIYLIVQIPNIKHNDIYIIYQKMHILITVNLIIFLIKSVLLIIVNILEFPKSWLLKIISLLLNEINFLSISLYLIYIFYLFYNLNEENKKIKIEDYDIINLEEEKNNLEIVENDEEEKEKEDNQEEKEKEDNQQEKINTKNDLILELKDIQF